VRGCWRQARTRVKVDLATERCRWTTRSAPTEREASLSGGDAGGQAQQEDMGIRLFVGNLSFDADKKTLQKAFAEVGAITDVHIVLEREMGRSRGFAFVTVASTELAGEAVSRLDGAELDGRALRVKVAPGR
jgi:nucleolin